MKLVKVEVSIAVPRVVELVAVGDLGQEGTWVSGQRVEEDAVDDDAGDLVTVSTGFPLPRSQQQ